MITYVICTICGLVGLAGLGVACWSIQQTHDVIRSRNYDPEDCGDESPSKGARLFMSFDICK